MTLGIPAAADEGVLESVVDQTDTPVFCFEPWTNEGGGHVYDDGFQVFRVGFNDQGCSCGALGGGEPGDLMDVRLLPHIAQLACRLGEIQFIVHWHRDAFSTEAFAVGSEVLLSADDLRPDTVFLRDTRYVVHC